MPAPKLSRVLMLTVSKDMRRRGIATELMERFIGESRLRGADLITLEVRRGNEAALNLYRKLGFHQADVIAAYYNDGEDAFRMDMRIGGH